MSDDRARETYRFERDQNLDETVREAVARDRGVDVSEVDVSLYDDFDPDGVDSLLYEDARPQTSVELTTNAVRVKLWGDGDVEVTVLGRDGDV